MKKKLKELYKEHISPYMKEEEITKHEWKLLKHHIETHKYWLNESVHGKEISLSEAFTSWLEYVFEPFLHQVKKFDVMKYTDKNIIQLYEEMMYDWFLKKDIEKGRKKVEINDVVGAYCMRMEKYPRWKKFKLWLRKSM